MIDLYTKEELRAWRDRHFGHHGNDRAADALGMSLDQFQKRLYGSVNISGTLTLLCQAIDREAMRTRLSGFQNSKL